MFFLLAGVARQQKNISAAALAALLPAMAPFAHKTKRIPIFFIINTTLIFCKIEVILLHPYKKTGLLFSRPVLYELV
ncbi:MAG: hypothetical protein JXA33_11785 [Anaerolineae bacterium]|nr:hypothetical protein [Anaerolineae bacterium]